MTDNNGCSTIDVEFLMLQGDATVLALEDDIREALNLVGVNVVQKILPREEYNAAMVAGEFNLAFSETWGPPYDPHSYANSWNQPNEAYYAALSGLPEPNTQAVLDQKIAAVQEEEDETARQTKWTEILSVLHEQATEIPFSGKSIPAVLNSARLSGYRAGLQQFDYPIHNLRVLTGGRNITISPGAQTGLFVGVGRLDPHSYRPNEFFSNNWVYEGLVEYGPDGSIEPSLAVSWTVEDNGTGQKYTFNLRQGVTFHDGAQWKCSVAKLNFDHVLAELLTSGDWHGWYGLPGAISNWNCASDYVFEVYTTSKYYPLLQELSYIRPLRMLSPNKFVGGATSDRYANNSCPVGWGHITGSTGPNITCAGTTGISGTGRWEYVETTYRNATTGDVQSVTFKRNAMHWDASSDSTQVDYVELVRYDSAAEVKQALIDGSLDAVIGDGVLDPADVASFQSGAIGAHRVVMTEPLQNRVVIFNTALAPTDDIANRKRMIHAVNKAEIIDAELGGLDEPVDSLFPKNAPYCGIDLTPRWDYDLEKVQLLCGSDGSSSSSDDGIPAGAVAGIAILGVLVAMFIGLFFYMRRREIKGKPLFSPLVTSADDTRKRGANNL